MELATLPEDDLLHVLGYLSPRELFQCRMVCRRWRDLALHPVIWRTKSLTATTVKCCPLVAATLRLAPCLRSLTVLEPLIRDPSWCYAVVTEDTTLLRRLGALLASTSCAMSEIDVLTGPTDALLLAVVVARQAALGRLKEIVITTSTHPDHKESSMYGLRQLLQQLLCTPGLQTIKLDIHTDAGALLKTSDVLRAAKHDSPVPPALRRLVFSTDLLDPNLPHYLEWHAATLEEVMFLADAPRAAPLLAALPRLRVLRCPLLADMTALLQCAALESLHVVVTLDPWTQPRFAGAASYLRAAVARLDSLVLEYVEAEWRAEAIDLVLALAGSGAAAPALRRLELQYTCPVSGIMDARELQPQLRPLVTVLHRLQHLVSLRLYCVLPDEYEVPDTVLDFNQNLHLLDGTVLPDLELLYFPVRSYCPHDWAHGKEARAVLQRYPRLHLEVSSHHATEDCEEYCLMNECHDFEDTIVTMFSHAIGENCGVQHAARQMHIAV